MPEEKLAKAPKIIQCCPECGGNRLMRDYDVAEIVCMGCGFVVAEKLTDEGPEWRVFDREQMAKRTRVGAPTSPRVHDKGLSTKIGWFYWDIYGKGLSPEQRYQLNRLRKWQRRIRLSNPTERSLAFSLSEISKTADKLNLPKNVRDGASVIVRKAAKGRLIRGRSVAGITAAAIYIECRQAKLSRTLEEIAQASNIDKKDVGRDYRFLVKELGYFIPPPEPAQYVTRLLNQLNVQGTVEEIAHKILIRTKELKLTAGRGPTGIAAAATYIASYLGGDKKTQREIAEMAKVTEVTIRNRYKELVRRLMFVVTL